MTDYVLRHKNGLRDFIENHTDLFDSNDLEALFRELEDFKYPETLSRSLKEFLESEYNIDIYDFIDFVPDCAYYFDDNLTDISLPPNIKTIGIYAFCGCRGLKAFKCPSHVKEIKGGAFAGCSNLDTIELPNSITELGQRAFESCEKLEYIDLPNAITSIGEFAFSNCRSLKEIKIPEGVTTIEQNAFSEDNELAKIIIPKSTTDIKKWAFAGCHHVDYLEIPQMFEPRLGEIFLLRDSVQIRAYIKQINYI